MLAEGGIAAAIGGEPVGQEMGPGCDIRLEKGAEFGARRGRQNRDPGVAGEEAVNRVGRGQLRAGEINVSSCSAIPAQAPVAIARLAFDRCVSAIKPPG